MFTYHNLLSEIDKFSQYGCEVGSIGTTPLGNRIPYIYMGKDKKKSIIVQGAIHGREHITALLTVCIAKYMLSRQDLPFFGGIYFIPMTNPDGVRIAQEGIDFIENEQLRNWLIEINKGNIDFSLWKANARGVDLNTNFDANWSKGKSNVNYASSSDYCGEKPLSESETRALAGATERWGALATISYHTKGEVIFWRYGQPPTRLWRDYRIAKGIAKATNYTLAECPHSHGGYKDWCISKLHIPAYTIEVGKDIYPHPYPYEEFFDLLQTNQDIPRRVVNSLAIRK